MPDEDVFELNGNGTVTFGFAGITRILKRPTLGQYRYLVEQLGAAKDALVGEDGNPENAAANVDITEQLNTLLSWIDDAFRSLSGEGLPTKTVYLRADGQEFSSKTEGEDYTEKKVIDDEKLPAWLLSGDVPGSLIQHWQTVPLRRGKQ